jgi:glycosyltransferase involved in cell wall biosynthesis
MNERTLRIGICSSYAPRACGLATFAADLEQALAGAPGVGKVSIVRMTNQEDRIGSDVGQPNEASTSILVDIAEEKLDSYVTAAAVANTSCDVIIVQHEFGIFGGTDGKSILAFMETLRVPILLTLHTVLPSFSDGQLSTLRRACELADAITVFTPAARQLLLGHGIAEPNKVVIVPHGAPDVLYEADRLGSRRALDLQHNFVVSTFGLVSPGKGLELAIAALPSIVAEIPETMFVVAGRTHPGVHRHAGEAYRSSLFDQVADLGLEANIRFVNSFLPIEGIAELLAATDVFVTPYVNLDQIVSGVLTFALAAGCPVVSTDYRYARDQLSKGAGTVVNSREPQEFADAVLRYARNSLSAVEARGVARRIGASMHWSAVGETMGEICKGLEVKARKRLVVREEKSVIHPANLNSTLHQVQGGNRRASRSVSLVGSNGGTTRSFEKSHRLEPPLTREAAVLLHPASAKLQTLHLERLIDDTGIVQHATGAVPLLSSGYCVDDVARLIPIAQQLAQHDRSWETVVSRSVAFLGHAIADVPEGGDARMHNFLGWDRRWLDDPCFGDHVGRAARGLASVAKDSRYDDVAMSLLKRLWREWPANSTLHPNAYGILAQTEAPESTNPRILASMVAELFCAYDRSASASWQWFEPELRYDYALFPQALLSAGMAAKNVSVTDLGLQTLLWLDDICDGGDFYRFPGCLGLAAGGDVNSSGDEQPLEALALAQAHWCAYELTNDPWHRSRVVRCHEWFLGRNSRGLAMVDVDGGCFDGLEAFTANRNQGAESTLAYCASRQLVSSMPKHQQRPARTEHFARPDRNERQSRSAFDHDFAPIDHRGSSELISTNTF